MTRTSHVALILGATLFSLTACQPAEQAGTTAQSAGQARALSTVDATFINSAGTSGLDEVAFAQLAGTKAADQEVRRFAEKTIADFTTVNQQLAVLAKGKGMTPASDMDGRHQVVFHELQSLNGAAFDRAYMDGQLQDLTVMMRAFQTEADSGSDPQVRSFAQQHLPMMLQHMQMAVAFHG